MYDILVEMIFSNQSDVHCRWQWDWLDKFIKQQNIIFSLEMTKTVNNFGLYKCYQNENSPTNKRCGCIFVFSNKQRKYLDENLFKSNSLLPQVDISMEMSWRCPTFRTVRLQVSSKQRHMLFLDNFSTVKNMCSVCSV